MIPAATKWTVVGPIKGVVNVGDAVYCDAAGTFTTVMPSGKNDVARVVGHAYDNETIALIEDQGYRRASSVDIRAGDGLTLHDVSVVHESPKLTKDLTYAQVLDKLQKAFVASQVKCTLPHEALPALAEIKKSLEVIPDVIASITEKSIHAAEAGCEVNELIGSYPNKSKKRNICNRIKKILEKLV